MKAAVNLQALLTNETIYNFPQLETMHDNYPIFTFISLPPRFSPNEMNIDQQDKYSQNSENLIQGCRWCYAVCRFNKKELSLHNFYLSILSKCFEKVPKDYTAKLLYKRLGKRLNDRHLHVFYRVNVLKKIENAQGKCPCWSPTSVTLPYDKTRLHHGRFQKYVPTFFSEQLFHKKVLRESM